MNVNATLQIIGGEPFWSNAFGSQTDTPGITLGVKTVLRLDMRLAQEQENPELPVYPYAELADCDSYYIAIDNDYAPATAPKLLRTTGISVAQEDGKTIFIAELPDTSQVAALVTALSTSERVTLNCEIGGFKTVDDVTFAVFAYKIPLVIRNRVWLGEGSETPDPSDPDYLNTAAVQSYINAAVAAATAELVGEAGPPPEITVGTVTTGTPAAATLVPGAEPGEYTLNLVIPAGDVGNTGPMPTLTVGTIAEGPAAATITPVTGGYAINITIPKGDDGIGVVFKGPWDDETTYGLNDAVRHGITLWRSLQADNLNNEPPASGDGNEFWEVIVRDGISPNPLLRAYNDTDDPDDPDWHSAMQAGDLYFKESLDGGVTWSTPRQISVGRDVIVLYNIDATTDWTALALTSPSDAYSSGYGKYMRLRRVGGLFGAGFQFHELAPQAVRAQFSSGGASPTWHATLLPGDRQVRFFNVAGTISQTVIISDGTFDVAEIQLANVIDPWHAVYAEGDNYRKISTDGGATFTLPIRLSGDPGIADYINDCKLRLLRPTTTAAAHLLIEASYDRDFANVINLINTATVTADRGKVLGLSGGEFVEMPAGGFPHAFAGKIVVVDMSSLALPAFIRYRWVYDGSSPDWLYTFFPSSGEAVAVSGGIATTGSLQVFLQGVLDGAWSIDEGATWRASGDVIGDLPPWTFTVTFKNVDGYTTPADASAVIEAGELTVLSAIYEVTTVTGDNAYIMNGTDARLVAQNVTEGVGSPVSIGGALTYYIVDGKMFRYNVLTGASIRVGTSDDWTAVAATETGAVAIRAGKLYAVTSSGAVSQIGSLTDWTATNGTFALRGAGYLYQIAGVTAYQLGSAVLPLPTDPLSSSMGLVANSAGALFYAHDASLETTGITGVSAVASSLHPGENNARGTGFVLKTDGTLAYVENASLNWRETAVTHGYGWLYIAPTFYSAAWQAYCYAVDDNGDLYQIFGYMNVSNAPATTKTFIASISLSDLSILGYSSTSTDGYGLWIRNAADLYHVAGMSAPVQVLTGKLVSYVSGGANPLVITQESI